ncbi:Protein lsr2 precursor [Mycobacteroides abscessus]|nr:Protein lsr2 precursor [Mycobacteroides abscessus]CPX06024.1 Protein lsr2 precursor [Mycobacteroides abscessus]CQA08733.1 Protein lsr2 precursor [Mycobacteroides abscessus]
MLARWVAGVAAVVSLGPGRKRASIDREQGAAIREWATKNGCAISSRGRIPAEVIDAFNAAN